MSQLAFQWPLQPDYAPEGFIVSESNRNAVTLVDQWPEEGKAWGALLCGPTGSGKTHLAFRWAGRVAATWLNAALLGSASSQEIWNTATSGILEDIETIGNEKALFHLLRHAELHGLHLLMTTRHPLHDLPFSLDDIRSRLRALPSASISEPDELLLHTYLAKACADRQWRVSPAVVNYLAIRTERSFSAIQALVRQMEALIASTHRELTIPLIKPLVEKI